MEKIIELILKKEWIESFEITNVEEKKGREGKFEDEVIIELKERASQIPQNIPSHIKLESKGYCSPIEVIDHPIGGMATYLKFYKRRWRDKTTGEEFSNTYEIRFPGTKITKRFGLFLKGEDRAERR